MLNVATREQHVNKKVALMRSLQEAQVDNMAARRGVGKEEVERWLTPNL